NQNPRPVAPLVPDPVAAAARVANTSVALTGGSAARHLFLIFALPLRLRTGTLPPSKFVLPRRAYNGPLAGWKPGASHARGGACREPARRAVADACPGRPRSTSRHANQQLPAGDRR